MKIVTDVNCYISELRSDMRVLEPRIADVTKMPAHLKIDIFKNIYIKAFMNVID